MNKFKRLQILGTVVLTSPIIFLTISVGAFNAMNSTSKTVEEQVVEVEEKVEKKVDTVVVVKEVPPPPPVVKKPVVVQSPPPPKMDSPKVQMDSVVEVEVKVEPDTTSKV
jgi:hypothetical protein